MSDHESIPLPESSETLDDAETLLNRELGNVTPIDEPQEHFDPESFTDPGLRDAYERVYGMLHEPIVLRDDSFKKNPYSATPGDPRHVFMQDGTPYVEAAQVYMYEVLKNKLLQVGSFEKNGEGMAIEDFQAVKHEIDHQHTNQVEKNELSFHRVTEKFLQDPTSVTEWRAIMISYVRSIDASIVERAVILNWYPEIDSLEDMKFTCFMDYPAYQEAKTKYLASIQAIEERTRGQFTARLIDKKELVAHPRQLDDLISKNVYADKTVIAEITSQEGEVFEVVEKLNQYAFPLDRKLTDVTPHFVNGKNLQPIYVQMYLRVKRDRSGSEDDEVTTENKYDADRMVILQNGIRRFIEDMPESDAESPAVTPDDLTIKLPRK